MEQDTTTTTNGTTVELDLATAQKFIQSLVDIHHGPWTDECVRERIDDAMREAGLSLLSEVKIVPPTPSVYVFVEGGCVTGAVGTHDVDVSVYDRDDRDDDSTLYYSDENFAEEDDKPEWMAGLDTSDCDTEIDICDKRADAHEAWIRASHTVVVY